MFLHHQQHPSNPTQLMAQVAGGLPLNPFFNQPFFEAPQPDESAVPNFVNSSDQGFCLMYNSVCQANTVTEHPLPRKRGRQSNIGESTKPKQIRRVMAKEASDNQACGSSSFTLSNEFAILIQKEMEDVDGFIVGEVEKLRAGIEEQRKKQVFNMLRCLQVAVRRLLKNKDEEIGKLCKHNAVLEEKARLLVMEGQTWRNIAQVSGATVLSLRRELEKAQAREGEGDSSEVASSSCHLQKERKGSSLNCLVCHKHEVSMLLLPCRHLCVCCDCDSEITSCPLCVTPKTASIQVHMP